MPETDVQYIDMFTDYLKEGDRIKIGGISMIVTQVKTNQRLNKIVHLENPEPKFRYQSEVMLIIPRGIKLEIQER